MANPNPYQRAMAVSETPRDVELRIMRTVNFSLKKAITENNNIETVRAVTNNYLVWQTFLYDVASDDNKLPRELRRSIAIVAKSVLKEIDDNMNNGKLDIQFLIDINENIIEGLASGPSTGR
jgi:flagellar biosynthesis activator protein FlaF